MTNIKIAKKAIHEIIQDKIDQSLDMNIEEFKIRFQNAPDEIKKQVAIKLIAQLKNIYIDDNQANYSLGCAIAVLNLMLPESNIIANSFVNFANMISIITFANIISPKILCQKSNLQDKSFNKSIKKIEILLNEHDEQISYILTELSKQTDKYISFFKISKIVQGIIFSSSISYLFNQSYFRLGVSLLLSLGVNEHIKTELHERDQILEILELQIIDTIDKNKPTSFALPTAYRNTFEGGINVE